MKKESWFDPNNLREMELVRTSLNSKRVDLFERFEKLKFRCEKANIHANHGYLRRVATMARCVDGIFHSIPPSYRHIPEDGSRKDAEINLQAFLFNLYGAIDNLAWIWVYENDIRGKGGSEFPKKYVGLRKSNLQLRKTFSDEFNEYLLKIDRWLSYVEDFRHAIAHQIPIYIPPFNIDPNDKDLYLHHEGKMWEALRRQDFEATEKAEQELEGLKHFMPNCVYSIGTDLRVMQFHRQVIVDFLTIEEIGIKFCEEVDKIGHA